MKTQKHEGEQQNKPVTRYDQKMEKRQQKAKEDARKDRIFNLACLGVGVLIIAAIVALFTTSASNRDKAIKDTYIKVGNHEVAKLEYDYYYYMVMNNYLNTYSSILPYMGLDTSKDFALQQYTDTMTWKDAFDEMAINQITNIKAMNDDAKANGFTADVNEKYSEFVSNVAANASTNRLSEAQYYKASFGQYATKQTLEPFVKENLLAEAYYDSLVDRFGPSEEEIASYYEENKNNYDQVTYRSFTFNADVAADASEEQTAEAAQQVKDSAEQMAERRKAGEDFKALCLEYAAEADKEIYQTEDNDASLIEKGTYAYTPSYYSDWLYDESREPGEVTVIEDEASDTCYVVEFVERIYDENTNETIKNALADEEVSAYVSALMEQYEVVDVTANLVYLTIPKPEEESTAAEEGTDEEAEVTEEAVEAAATEADVETTGEEPAATASELSEAEDQTSTAVQ